MTQIIGKRPMETSGSLQPGVNWFIAFDSRILRNKWRVVLCGPATLKKKDWFWHKMQIDCWFAPGAKI